MFWKRKKKEKDLINAVPYGDVFIGRFPFVLSTMSPCNTVFNILSNEYVPFYYTPDEDNSIKRILSMSEYFKVPNDENVGLNLKNRLLRIGNVDFDISDGIYLIYDIVTSINGIYSKEKSRSHGFIHLIDMDKVGDVLFNDGIPVKDFRIFSEDRKSYLQEYEFLAIYVKLPLIPVKRHYATSTLENDRKYSVPTIEDLFNLNKDEYNIGDIVTVNNIHTNFILVDDMGVKKYKMVVEKSESKEQQAVNEDKKEDKHKLMPVYDEEPGKPIPTPGIIYDLPITEYNFDNLDLENGTMYWYKNGDKNFTYIYSKDKQRWIPYATFNHLKDKTLHNVLYGEKSIFGFYNEEEGDIREILSGLPVDDDYDLESVLIDPGLYICYVKDKVFTELSYTYYRIENCGMIDIIPEEGSGDNRGIVSGRPDKIYILYMDNSEPAIHFTRGDNIDIVSKLSQLSSEYSILAVYVHI